MHLICASWHNEQVSRFYRLYIGDGEGKRKSGLRVWRVPSHFWVWKCAYCGEYIDQVILENRQIQKSNREKSAKNNEEPIYRSYSDAPSV